MAPVLESSSQQHKNLNSRGAHVTVASGTLSRLFPLNSHWGLYILVQFNNPWAPFIAEAVFILLSSLSETERIQAKKKGCHSRSLLSREQ